MASFVKKSYTGHGTKITKPHARIFWFMSKGQVRATEALNFKERDES
jgi:hypothetical protein